MKGGWRGRLETLRRYRPALLAAGAGLLLLLLPGTLPRSSTPDPAPQASSETASAQEDLERRLEQILSQVAGAGEVRVVLSVKAGERQIPAQDLQRDGERSSSQVVTVGGMSAGQEVAVLQTLAPEYQGALVVCPGGDDPQVRLTLSQAVMALTGLGSDKITVCKGNLIGAN